MIELPCGKASLDANLPLIDGIFMIDEQKNIIVATNATPEGVAFALFEIIANINGVDFYKEADANKAGTKVENILVLEKWVINKYSECLRAVYKVIDESNTKESQLTSGNND